MSSSLCVFVTLVLFRGLAILILTFTGKVTQFVQSAIEKKEIINITRFV